MTQPLVSIVIPTYNRADFIGIAIKSALNQTYRSFEIIVVDDGSKDNTREVVGTFGSAVRYVYKNNSGQSQTRNLGIREAKGEYIALLDSDDLWEPEKLAKQVEEFRKAPDIGLVSSNYRFIDQENRTVKDPGSAVGYVPDEFFVKDLLRIRFPFATSSFLIRRSVLNNVGSFNEKLRISEDLDLLVRIGLKYKMSYVDEVLISVRLHENHLMKETPRYQVWLNSVNVLETYYDQIKARLSDIDPYYANFYSIAANSALLSGNRLKALQLHGQALKYVPCSFKSYKDLIRCFLPLRYLKMRYEKSLKVEMHEKLKQYS